MTWFRLKSFDGLRPYFEIWTVATLHFLSKMSTTKVKSKPTGAFADRRKSTNQIHFMGDFKGKVIVAPAGILRHERSLVDVEADHQARMEELNGHRRLLTALRERMTTEQLGRLVVMEDVRRGGGSGAIPKDEAQPCEGSSSPPRYEPTVISPTKISVSKGKDAQSASPSSSMGQPVSPQRAATPRSRGLASLLAVIRTSLVMEGLLVKGNGGLQPKPQ